MERIRITNRTIREFIEKISLQAGILIPNTNSILIVPPFATGKDLRISVVEAESASSEAPELVFMADMETMKELGGGRREESHTSGGKKDVGGVKEGGGVDALVVESDRRLFDESPVVDVEDGAVGDAAAAGRGGGNGDSIAGGGAGDGGGVAETIAVERTPASGADEREKTVEGGFAEEKAFRKGRGEVELARAEKVEEDGKARRIPVEEVLRRGVSAGGGRTIPVGIDQSAEHGIAAGDGESCGGGLEELAADVEADSVGRERHEWSWKERLEFKGWSFGIGRPWMEVGDSRFGMGTGRVMEVGE